LKSGSGRNPDFRQRLTDVDLTKDDLAVQEVDELAALLLTLWAGENGYQKVTRSALWSHWTAKSASERGRAYQWSAAFTTGYNHAPQGSHRRAADHRTAGAPCLLGLAPQALRGRARNIYQGLRYFFDVTCSQCSHRRDEKRTALEYNEPIT